MAGRKAAKKAHGSAGSEGVVWKNRIVKYGEVDLDQALANPDNWRIHPYEQQQALQGVLVDVGIVQNIIVNLRSGPEWPDSERGVETFIDGHLRASEGLKQGQKSWPATYVDLSPNEERLVLLSLDAIADLAVSDDAALERLFAEVKAEDERTLAFLQNSADDYGIAFGGEKDIKDVPPKLDKQKELLAKWNVRVGDVWALGDHKLICGDSKDPAVVKELFAGETAALFSTDPPYLVEYTGGGRPGGERGGKTWGRGKDWSSLYDDGADNPEDKRKFLLDVFNAWLPYLRKDAAWFVWHASRTQGVFEAAMNSVGVMVHQQIIWVKPIGVLGYSKYFYRHEPCFFGWQKGHEPHIKQGFYGMENSTVWTDGFDGISGDEVLMQIYEQSTVWDIDWGGKKRIVGNLHPTEKPIEIFARPMRNHTKQGEICAEPFSGSGSQILAGEKVGRIVYAAELEPSFVAVSLERFLDATGLTPVLLKPGPVTEDEWEGAKPDEQ